jgi:hypothetical protein
LCWLVGGRALGISYSSVTFFELLIFRINNLGENFFQIFGTKGLICNIFVINILAGLASLESSLSKYDLLYGSASGLGRSCCKPSAISHQVRNTGLALLVNGIGDRLKPLHF